MRVLRSPVWQFISVIVALVAIAVSLALYFRSQPIRKLRVDILSNSPLVSVDTGVARELQILYRGTPVHSLSVILLKLANTGTEPITQSDYSEPIRVLISPHAAVGQVVVQETRPGGIRLNPTISATNQVELARVLLNPGDQAVLKLLALNNDSTLQITSRIAGIRELEVHSVLDRSDRTSTEFGLRVILWSLVALLVLLVPSAFIWQSRGVIEWRRERFGFDPARYYYELAQTTMLMPKQANSIGQVIGYLHKAFTWDSGYVGRTRDDVLFSPLLGYQPLRDLLDKYTGVPSPTSGR